MLKIVLIAFILFGLLQDKSQAAVGQACSRSDECQQGSECCVDPARLRGRRKRQVTTPTCQPIGLLHQDCFVEQSQNLCGQEDKTCRLYCSCAQGLTCQPTGSPVNIPYGTPGTCRP